LRIEISLRISQHIAGFEAGEEIQSHKITICGRVCNLNIAIFLPVFVVSEPSSTFFEHYTYDLEPQTVSIIRIGYLPNLKRSEKNKKSRHFVRFGNSALKSPLLLCIFSLDKDSGREIEHFILKLSAGVFALIPPHIYNSLISLIWATDVGLAVFALFPLT
jgi:hypothetical protein